MTQLLTSDTLDRGQREEAAQTRDLARSAFNAGYIVFKAHGRPTCSGQRAMDGAVDYILH